MNKFQIDIYNFHADRNTTRVRMVYFACRGYIYAKLLLIIYFKIINTVQYVTTNIMLS